MAGENVTTGDGTPRVSKEEERHREARNTYRVLNLDERRIRHMGSWDIFNLGLLGRAVNVESEPVLIETFERKLTEEDFKLIRRLKAGIGRREDIEEEVIDLLTEHGLRVSPRMEVHAFGGVRNSLTVGLAVAQSGQAYVDIIRENPEGPGVIRLA